MLIDFQKMTTEILPAFKGGEKEYRAKMFFDGTTRVMKGTLIPGASIGLHTHEGNAEVMFFTAGTGYAICDGVKEPVKAGDCHFCPEGHSHTLINDSDTDLEFYAVVR